MKYEETFIVFIDFLGFSEASMGLDEPTRQKVLELLLSLVALRGEFSAAVTNQSEGSTSYAIRPAVSTFSDHIVISYGLETLSSATQLDVHGRPAFIYSQTQK